MGDVEVSLSLLSEENLPFAHQIVLSHLFPHSSFSHFSCTTPTFNLFPISLLPLGPIGPTVCPFCFSLTSILTQPVIWRSVVEDAQGASLCEWLLNSTERKIEGNLTLSTAGLLFFFFHINFSLTMRIGQPDWRSVVVEKLAYREWWFFRAWQTTVCWKVTYSHVIAVIMSVKGRS